MHALNRYDYLRLCRIIGQYEHLEFLVIGGIPNENGIDPLRVKALYQSGGSNIKLVGSLPAAEYDEAIASCLGTFFSGYLPGEVTPPFEHMNYQLRYNSALKTGVLPIVAKGSGKWHEDEIRATGFGIVLESIADVETLGAQLKSALPYSRESWSATVEQNSFETYASSLANFLVGT
jgi:hypothetical protein